MIDSIILNDISYKYDDNYVINNFNSTFYQNNIYGLFGKNASGKSTLLKLIAGILKPQLGKIEYHKNNTPINSKINVQSRITFSAPYINFVPELTPKENYFIISKLKGQNIDNDKLETLLDLFSLRDFYNKRIDQLSTGTISKFKLNLNLIFESNINLFDEPFENIDEQSKNNFINYITKSRNNKIIIISSTKKEELNFSDYLLTL